MRNPAYSELFDLTDQLKKDYLLYDSRGELGKASGILESMCRYQETILKKPKFRSQREYNKAAIIEINYWFAKGYFKLKEDKK